MEVAGCKTEVLNNQSESLRVAIYLQGSSNRFGFVEALFHQEQRLKDYAHEQGWKVADIYLDITGGVDREHASLI
jgi:hypothetical protein